MTLTDPAAARVEAAEQALGVSFNNPALLELALVHASLLNEPMSTFESPPEESNERLEFLGDAVLDLIVAEYLYARYPEMPEGQLTVNRAMLVRRETLAGWSQTLGLGDLLRVGRGEVHESGVSQRVLASAFEAIVGAIYLDQGLEAATCFVGRTLDHDASRLLSAADFTNYKGILQEHLQQHGTTLPEYIVTSERGPDHEREFVVESRHHGRPIGAGTGRSKRAAEQAAARDALSRMDLLMKEPPARRKATRDFATC